MSQVDIEALLRQKIGLDASSIGSNAIARVVQHRMSHCGLSDEASYLTRLQTSPEELAELIEDAIVPETWFFRDREPFTFLARYAVSEWLPAHPHGVLRLLSVPCSTGEEPYSIAIALLEAGLAPKNFHIDAVDISEKALLACQRGIYGNNSFRGENIAFPCAMPIPSNFALRERYFQPTQNGYQLCERVRSTVNFFHGNILDRSILINQAPYDVIFCRNLLIYLTREAREHTVSVLERLLAQQGLLFVGHSETGQLLTSRFVSLRHPRAFAYRKPEPASEGTALVPALMARVRKYNSRSHRPAFGEASPFGSVPANREIAKTSSPTNHPPIPPCSTQPSLLETARNLADRGCLNEAAQVCETYLSQNRISVEAYVLLALVHQAAERQEQAEQCLNKAIYLEPNHYEALTHLALLKENCGDFARAAIIQKRLQRLDKFHFNT